MKGAMKGKALVLAAAVVMLGTSVGQATLVAYWNFDQFTPGDNPDGLGLPQSHNEGTFADVTGNGQTAYAANFNTENYDPIDPTGGRNGSGAFYSKQTPSDTQRGTMAVVPHSDVINFNQESFTYSFWEMVSFRDVAGKGWGDGRGRTQFFMKAPYIPPEDPNVTVEGLGLNLTQNHFDVLANMDDNFGQAILDGGRYTYPSGASPDDSGQWCHWAITGQYRPGTDDYEIIVYKNGTAVDWDGAQDTTLIVPNSVIDNDGFLTIGAFWRNNSYAHQRFLSFMTGSILIEAWLDDFAMWDEVLSAEDLADLADGTKTPANWLVSAQPGDFNGDAMVEQSDLNLLLANWGASTVPPAWTAQFDGLVDQNELNDLLANWGTGVPGADVVGGTETVAPLVPEPATFGLLLLGGLAGLTRRR